MELGPLFNAGFEAGVKAERERCVKIVDDLRRAKEEQVKDPTPGYSTAGYLEALEHVKRAQSDSH